MRFRNNRTGKTFKIKTGKTERDNRQSLCVTLEMPLSPKHAGQKKVRRRPDNPPKKTKNKETNNNNKKKISSFSCEFCWNPVTELRTSQVEHVGKWQQKWKPQMKIKSLWGSCRRLVTESEIPVVVLQEVSSWQSLWQTAPQSAESLREQMSAELPTWDMDLELDVNRAKLSGWWDYCQLSWGAGVGQFADDTGVSQLPKSWWGSYRNMEHKSGGFADWAVVCEATRASSEQELARTELQSFYHQPKSQLELWNWCRW